MRAEAHATGVSQSDFTLDSPAHVHASIVLARSDAAIVLRGPDEASAARDLVDEVDVRADGAACAGTVESASVVGSDGFELRASFVCPHAPRTLAVSLPLLDELPAGHVHLIRLAAPGAEVQAILRSGAQEASLVVAGGAPRSFARAAANAVALGATHIARGWEPLLFLLALALVVAAFTVARLRRSRVRRR